MIVSFRLLKIAWNVDPKTVTVYFLTSLVPAVIPFLNAYIFKLVIDAVVAAISGQPIEMNTLYLLIGSGMSLQFVQDVVYRVQSYNEIVLYTKLPIHLNQLVLSKIISLDAAYFEDSDFKNTLEKVRDTMSHRPQNLLTELLYISQNIIQVGIGLVAIWQLNSFLIIFILFVVLPEFYLSISQSHISWGIWSANSQTRKRFWYLSGLLQDQQQIKEIKLYSLGKRFLKEIKEVQEAFFYENLKAARKTHLIGVVYNLFSTIVYVGIQVYVLLLVLSRKATVGDIQFYQSVVNQFSGGMRGMLRGVTSIFEHALYVQSIFEVLDAPSLLSYKTPGTLVTGETAPLIEFREVTFSYPGSKKPILKQVSLTINPGDKIAFVGENGAGKSTIIRLLARFYDVDSGEILINGVNIKEIDLQSWYDRLGVLFQDFARYEHTVKDNIYFGNIGKSPTLSFITLAAKEGGSQEFVEELPKKYEQMLGRTFEGGEELSTGQWQKIALSRAFFRNAPVLVLDEPTASIDAKAENEIFKRVDKLTSDKTVIIISHRFSTVRHADRIYVLHDGAIQEQGNHQELMKLEGRYAKLFTLQAKGYQ